MPDLGDHLTCRLFSEATGSGDCATVLATIDRELEKPFAFEQAAASARAALAAYTRAGLLRRRKPRA